MNNIRLLLPLACLLALSGCGLLKEKTAGYYLDKARQAARSGGGAADLAQGYRYLDRAADYAPGSGAIIEALRELGAASDRAGFVKGHEQGAALLRRLLAADGANWAAREALIAFLAERGDVSGLADEALAAARLADGADARRAYCARVAQLAATAAAVPWLESEAVLSLNKSPETFLEKAGIYTPAVEQVASLKAELEKTAAADPSLKSVPPASLATSAEVSAADVLRDTASIVRAAEFNSLVSGSPGFKAAVYMLVQGNASLAAKKYTEARAYYQGALARYPAFTDATRQLAETDFQEGAALAAVGGSGRTASQLLDGAYAGALAAASACGEACPLLPFVRRDKFLGETYALRAAVLAAVKALRGPKLRNAARLEAEFKSSLEEALRLNPSGGLARSLSERYAKEGF
jgi:hypothetical protein